MLEPRLADEVSERILAGKLAFYDRVFEETGDLLDVVCEADDLGTQRGPLISPETYRKRIKPFQARLFAHIRRKAPGVKIFYHSCGAVAEFIPDLIEMGVDALNPVQVSAAGMEPLALKREYGREIAFWGGGIDTQRTLPRGTPAQVREEVRRRAEAWGRGAAGCSPPCTTSRRTCPRRTSPRCSRRWRSCARRRRPPPRVRPIAIPGEADYIDVNPNPGRERRFQMYQKIATQKRLSQEIAGQIKTLIRSEKLKPGDKLPNENELSTLFGVSRPTVREAIKTLVSRNIIEVVRGRGTYVSHTPGISSDPLGLDFLADGNLVLSLVEARLLIEPGVAHLAARKAGEEDLQRLGECIQVMEGIIRRQEVDMGNELAFHRGIAQASQNPVILRIVPIILDSIVKTYQEAPRTSADHRQALLEHRRIFEAIRKKDPRAAQEAMRRHLENSYRRTLKKLGGTAAPKG